ncbi:hypothetical protein GOP47_0005618 [Adiantum capillus-veneris]|uniref:PGG domain-containing protein n=1 Tax=Adiantum capillus-veneris TaxID=13818 RepID=A0A9D4ZLR5_ADICA|nr:hypothetical protein GOP47_0005618 [Adiantum capillus-veneris]
MAAPPELRIAVRSDGLDSFTFTPSSTLESYELTPRPDHYVRVPVLSSNQTVTDDGGNTFLHKAARAADLKQVRKLVPLASRSSLHVANAAGFMPLHYIAKHRGKAWNGVLVAVLKKGGFTNSANLDGDTPLHIAARTQNMRGVKALVKYASETGELNGCLPKNRAGQTPLDVAVAATTDPTMSDAILTLVTKTNFLNELFGAVWGKYGTSVANSQGQGIEDECPQAYLLWQLCLQRSSPSLSSRYLNTLWWVDREAKLSMLKQWVKGNSWLYDTLLWLVPREDFDVQHMYAGGQTILHIALSEELEEIVKLLFKRQDLVEADTEDEKGFTPVQHAVEKGLREIEIMLLRRPEVRESVERLYRDRQVYVDAANAILVGSALIASVTFAGWLQPPLGYGNGKENAKMYVAIEGHPGVSSFWVFNSLSFLFAMATMVAGAAAVLPRPDLYIGTAVRKLKLSLSMAAFLLLLSAICGIGAFCSAGFAVLPPTPKWDMRMVATVMLGGLVNVFMMGWFMKGLLHLRPGHAKRMKEKALRRVQQKALLRASKV